jgi:hypothetical protein
MRIIPVALVALSLVACSAGSSVPSHEVAVAQHDAGAPANAGVRSAQTLQPYLATNVGDTVQVTVAQPFKDAPTPFACPGDPTKLYPYEKPQTGDQAYVYASPFVVKPYQPLYVTMRPCNVKLGDVVQATLLPGSISAQLNISLNGFVAFLPVGGVAKFHLADVTGGASEDVTVNGVDYSALALAPRSVTLATAGAFATQAVTISENGYTQGYTKTNTCAGLATFGPVNRVGAVATVQATGVAPGSCSYTAKDVYGQSVTVPVLVAYPPLVIAPKAATLAQGSTLALAISEDGYSQVYEKTNTCVGFASFSKAIRVGSVATVEVGGIRAGSCSFTARDVYGQTVTVPVTVTAGR